MGNTQGIEGGVFMSTGSLQSSSSDDSLEKSRREGSFKYVPAACLPTVHSAEPRLSPNVCRGARSQQSDPRASPSPEGTDPTLRNTSGAEQRGRSGPEPQGTRLASGTYTVSAVDAAEVRGGLAAVMHALGHGACGLSWGPIASAASGLAPSPAVPLATVPRAAQAKEARHAISGPTTWVESVADRGCTPAPRVTRPKGHRLLHLPCSPLTQRLLTKATVSPQATVSTKSTTSLARAGRLRAPSPR